MDWLALWRVLRLCSGFFGTVTGMISAFMQIQNLQGNVNPSVIGRWYLGSN